MTDVMMERADRIQRAILAAKEQGLFIRRCNWGTYWCKELNAWACNGDEVDALGALILFEQPPFSLNEIGAITHLFNVPYYWVLDFRDGFHEWTGCLLDRFGAYRLGAWLGSIYLDDLFREV